MKLNLEPRHPEANKKITELVKAISEITDGVDERIVMEALNCCLLGSVHVYYNCQSEIEAIQFCIECFENQIQMLKWVGPSQQNLEE